MSEGVN